MNLKIRWVLMLAAGLAPLLAAADPPHGRGGRGGYGAYGGPPDMRRFEHRELHVWRGGAWRQGWHQGRSGWWWVVGGVWYFYPQVVYPYPDPYAPPVVVLQTPPPTEAAPVGPPPAQFWYYCEAARKYYPYVASCEGGWKPVPVTPNGETK